MSLEFTSTINVLDYGFVTLRNMAGPTRRPTFLSGDGTANRVYDADDTDVANSARMSFEGQDKDRSYEIEMKLNRYLAQNRHMTPFESIEVWLEMKLPIFVARQFVRHRTTSLNEVSARYVQLPEEWYIPELEDVMFQTGDKKQGGRKIDLNNPAEVAAGVAYQTRLNANCQQCYDSYKQSIQDGIAMEQARFDLHVNHYTHWLWKQDLRNLFGFLALRDHSHAQGESSKYAKAIIQLLDPHIPGLMTLYREVFK